MGRGKTAEKDYLVLSIISFLFCFPLAIPAFLFSIKTREASYYGDHKRAQRNSRLALGFSIASIVLGCIAIISCIVLCIMRRLA